MRYEPFLCTSNPFCFRHSSLPSCLPPALPHLFASSSSPPTLLPPPPIFPLPPHPFKTINDWYDREIDAINEPNRPIPSGAISEQQVRGGGILGEGKNSKQEKDQRVKEG